MAASRRHINWDPVEWTGTLPVTTKAAMTGVTNVQIDRGGELAEFSGDNDAAPTTVVGVYQRPTMNVTFADLAYANSLNVGDRGMLEATHLDARNGATPGEGAYKVILSTAVVQNVSSGGQHRQFGQATVPFVGESPDGEVSPLSFADIPAA